MTLVLNLVSQRPGTFRKRDALPKRFEKPSLNRRMNRIFFAIDLQNSRVSVVFWGRLRNVLYQLSSRFYKQLCQFLLLVC